MVANQATMCGPFRQKVLQSSREGGDRFARRLRLFWRRGVARIGGSRGGLSPMGDCASKAEQPKVVTRKET